MSVTDITPAEPEFLPQVGEEPTPAAAPAPAAPEADDDDAVEFEADLDALVEGAGADDDDDEGGADDAEELVEIEFNGQKFKAPKALQAELAAARAPAPEPAATAPATPAPTADDQAAEAEAEAEYQKDVGYLAYAYDKLAEFEAITPEQRAQIRNVDLARAQELADNENALRSAINAAEDRVAFREDQAAEQQRAAAEQAANSAVEAARKFATEIPKVIPGWNAKQAAQVSAYAMKVHGYTREELQSIRDPRQVKILHSAMQQDLARAKQLRQKASETAPKPTSTPTKGRGVKASALPSSSDSMDTWVEKEAARMNRAGRR